MASSSWVETELIEAARKLKEEGKVLDTGKERNIYREVTLKPTNVQAAGETLLTDVTIV